MKLTQEEGENMNNSISMKEMEVVLNNLPPKKTTVLDVFTG